MKKIKNLKKYLKAMDLDLAKTVIGRCNKNVVLHPRKCHASGLAEKIRLRQE